ncbi:outer membrane beta-barrel protein [Luteibacter aegosomatissinici]|uniref:outer membrane beta-barrel protein n=1 Tax=Luteibacter aegosomatissinici TaxID=2911539 RepID=UPI001FF808B7|nr:outer membrane beta-barrel protein [Luteibacter aegosomatissinici]UPG96409.1 outer membrane beta-barrel protein [Luteibacter aegosomatissinici]
MPAVKRLTHAVLLGLVCAAPAVSQAGTLDYTLYAGLEHSNNITLSSDNPISENVLTPGATFQFTQMGSTFQANVAGTLEYRKYLQNHFDSQTQTQIVGQGNWTVMPDRLDFSVEDYAGVQPVDQLSADSPDNQQQTNVFAAGPTLHMRFGDATRGQFELRYINSYASKVDDFDSNRGMAAFRLFRDLTPTDTISGNVEYSDINFKNQPSSANYKREEAYLRYTSQLAHFDADVMLGGTRLNFDEGRDRSSPLLRVQVGWQPTLRNSFAVAGTYQYADAATDIMTTPSVYGLGATDNSSRTEALDPFANTGGLGRGSLSGIGVGSAVIGSQVYKEKRFEANWNWKSERLNITVSPAWNKLQYIDDSTFNQTGKGLSVGVGYRVTPTLTLSGFGTADRLRYDTIDRTDNTVRLGLDLGQQWNRHWSWHASVARERRTSDAVGQSYRETEFFVGVVYRR